MKLLFINGVNLNMTGIREKDVYGSHTLDEINCEIVIISLTTNANFIRAITRAISAPLFSVRNILTELS